MRAGKVAVSTKLNLDDPRACEIASMFGFDCIWIDLEHVPSSMSNVENMVRAAKIYDVDVMTRVSKGSYSDIVRPLEADSTGVMVPHLMSLEEAKKIAYFTKFHPVGRRPIDGGNADGRYCLVDVGDYITEANRERFTVVQIEDPEPVAELEEICKLPGIDMIFFGPAANFDALVDMGYTFINVGADVVALGNYYRELFPKVEGRDIKEVK